MSESLSKFGAKVIYYGKIGNQKEVKTTMNVTDENKAYFKSLLTKAFWAGVYGGVAEFAAFSGKLSSDTLVFAVSTALARAGIIFLTDVYNSLKEKNQPLGTASSVSGNWKNHL